MKILAIDTATEVCSAALYLDGEVRERFEMAPRRHAELILPMMDGLLAEAGMGLADLDALAFGRGPGAFTGVRIATGVVQGAAFGADLPVAPVSNLAALAQRAVRELGAGRVLAALDARMGEVYWGGYVGAAEGLVEPALIEEVGAPEEVGLPDSGIWWGAGPGWAVYRDRLSLRLGDRLERVEPAVYCSAHDIALLAVRILARDEAVPAEQALPVYLRDRVAAKKGGG